VNDAERCKNGKYRYKNESITAINPSEANGPGRFADKRTTAVEAMK
jgi:hypothetical protein